MTMELALIDITLNGRLLAAAKNQRVSMSLLVSIVNISSDGCDAKVWCGDHGIVLEFNARRPLVPSFVLQEYLNLYL